MRPYVPAIALALVVPFSVHADSRTVSSHHTLHVNGGEAQSTVVPPNVNDQCKGGRFLVSNDTLRPPKTGLVTGRNLDDPDGADVVATFDSPPGQTSGPDPALVPRYQFGTNDHDLLALPNGHVLYLTGAFTRAPINKPWAKDTFRNAFGPNARSNLMVWRSTDCGQSFQFHGELDPIDFEDGSCANPQFRTDAAGKAIEEAPWDMGGSDGQLVNYDPDSGRLFLTFRCVGYNAKPGTPFAPDIKNPLKKTLIAESSDEGKSWTSDGFMNGYNHWRMGVIPFDANKTLAFGYYDGVTFGRRDAQGKFVYDGSITKAKEGNFGYDNDWPMLARDNPYFKALKWAHSVVGRTPGGDGLFLVFPDTVGNAGQGFRIMFVDATTGKTGEPEEPIVPAATQKNMNNFLLHPVVIDNGNGPPLLYWNDVEWKTKTVTIRGRFILGEGQYSDDFVISREGAKDHTFTFVKGCPPHWFGDYQTAGGGFKKASKINQQGPLFSYFPMWIEPDDTIHFARVDLSLASSPGLEMLKVRKLDARRFTMRPLRVGPSSVRPPHVFVESERDD